MNRRRCALATPTRPRPLPKRALEIRRTNRRSSEQDRSRTRSATGSAESSESPHAVSRRRARDPSWIAVGSLAIWMQKSCRERVAAPDEGCRPAPAPRRAHCRAGDAAELRGSRGSDRLGGVIGPRAAAETPYPREAGKSASRLRSSSHPPEQVSQHRTLASSAIDRARPLHA